MLTYILHDKDGNIVTSGRTGSLDHVKIPDGQTLVEIPDGEEIPHIVKDKYDLEKKTLVGLIPQTDQEVLDRATFTTESRIQSPFNKEFASGFKSSALGTEFLYGSKDLDQHNLVITATTGGSVWAEGPDGWVFRPHTAEQAQQVLRDFTAFRDALRTKLAAKKALLAQAKTKEDVVKITW